MPRSIWEMLYGQYGQPAAGGELPDVGAPAISPGPTRPGVPWAENLANKLPEAAVQGMLSAVKTPGQLMQPNPYPPGSEEAAFYDAAKTSRATEWAPEMAMNVMGTGGVVGLPLQGAETALGAGILRPKRPPPLLETMHGTGAPREFTEFKLPRLQHDLGIHTTVDPTVAEMYAYPSWHGEGKYGRPVDPNDPDLVGVRTKPILTDVQSALRYPTDAGKWNDPANVITGLEDAMRSGFAAPRGLLSDMYNIAGSNKTWQNQFIPMLKEKGYDAIYYPHASELGTHIEHGGRPKYNTFMAFDPGQIIHKFSPEGLELARERGVHPHMKPTAEQYYEGIAPSWRLPKGILQHPAEVESFVRSPGKNTVKWWEDPESPLSQIKKKQEDYVANINKEAEAKKAAVEHWKPYYDYLEKNPGTKWPPGFDFTKSSGHTPAGLVEILKQYNEFLPPEKPKSPMFGAPKPKGTATIIPNEYTTPAHMEQAAKLGMLQKQNTQALADFYGVTPAPPKPGPAKDVTQTLAEMMDPVELKSMWNKGNLETPDYVEALQKIHDANPSKKLKQDLKIAKSYLPKNKTIAFGQFKAAKEKVKGILGQ